MFCKGTIEEKVCLNMSEKIANIAQLNDGDLLSHQIEGLNTKEEEKKEEMSELGKLFLRMETLESRKKRLLQELKETEDELKEVEKCIQSNIQ